MGRKEGGLALNLVFNFSIQQASALMFKYARSKDDEYGCAADLDERRCHCVRRTRRQWIRSSSWCVGTALHAGRRDHDPFSWKAAGAFRSDEGRALGRGRGRARARTRARSAGRLGVGTVLASRSQETLDRNRTA
jgi:hypothetical protein